LKLVRVSHSYGTYGFGLPSASAMRAILRLFEEGKDRTTFPPDVEWYNLTRNERWKIYAAEPLLIRHPEYSWSSTWNCKRRSAWAWNRRIISDGQAIAERAKVDPSVRQHKGLCDFLHERKAETIPEFDVLITTTSGQIPAVKSSVRSLREFRFSGVV